MGHLGTDKQAVFHALAKRLHENPIGAPLNETLMRILYTLYDTPEAHIGAHFPQGMTTLTKLASLTGLDQALLAKHLDNMASKGLVIDIPRRNTTLYALTPLVIGFFEYTFMRVTERLPLADLAQLFEQYHHERGVAAEFFGAETKIFQTWPYESLLPETVETEVLDYEKASYMIRESGGGSLTMCYCRHQALHRGAACSAPLEDVCMSLGAASEWLVRRGFARAATTDEMLRVLETTERLGLVHLADNVQNNPAFLCHCCGCCCGALRTINEHQIAAVKPSSFIAQINQDLCMACAACLPRCHVHAIKLDGTTANVEAKCIGCGACLRACPQSAIGFAPRPHRIAPPKNKIEQMQMIAGEKGRK